MRKYRESYRAFSLARLVSVFSCVLSVCLFSSKAFSEELLSSADADVRVIIDVSGSMKRNDPKNLRQPAVELLVKLLPEGSEAGVWTFGKWVNMLIPHGEVDEAWRKSAAKKAKDINSVGLYTNIGGALEKALSEVKSQNKTAKKSIILLTDGMVDIDKKPDLNKKEWRRIVDDVLPKLQAAGYTIHTIALSDNADDNLLTKLSLATDGIAETAHSADDLMRIFLKAFDAAAPAEQLPFSDNQFVVDSSVEEFTALIFREKPSENTELLGPDGEEFSEAKASGEVKWHRGENYDLVTVKRPLEGSWSVKGDIAANSRITVVSNLNLRVTPMPNNIMKGHEQTLVMSLQEDGKTVTRKEFLELMSIEAAMEAGNDEFSLQEFWREEVGAAKAGKFKKDLPTFEKDGIYQLNVIVDGKSFLRQFNHQFFVRQPFGAEIKSVFNDGKLEYHIIATSFNTDIDIENTQVVAVIEAPGGSKKIRPLKSTDQDTWQATFVPDREGKYKATVKAKGAYSDGSRFELALEPIVFTYSADAGFVEEEEPFFEEEPKPAKKDKKDKKEEDKSEQTEEAAQDEEEAEPAESAPIPSWMLYAILGVGNLLLLGGGFFAYKKIMGGDSQADELDEELGDTKEASEAEASVAAVSELEDAEDEEEEEPPMEDLDPSDDEEPEPEPEPEFIEPEPLAEESPEDDLDLDPEPEPSPEPTAQAVESAIDEIFDENPLADAGVDTGAELEPEPEVTAEPEPDPEPEPAAAPEPTTEEIDALIDGFDDLDQMAMESTEKPDDAESSDAPEEELPVSGSDDDDDMVSEMLKAQGLDLAGEELDNAISSLIDDLQGDDDPKK